MARQDLNKLIDKFMNDLCEPGIVFDDGDTIHILTQDNSFTKVSVRHIDDSRRRVINASTITYDKALQWWRDQGFPSYRIFSKKDTLPKLNDIWG